MSSRDECIFITGAAGFIGSALARAIAAACAAKLVLLDVSEQAMIELESSLKASAGEFHLVLGNAADARTMRSLLHRYRPRTVIHAAAYKHVVTLEYQLEAAVRNNALASFDLALASSTQGVERFLLISTDKAVAPHSVMGAAKRAAELLTLSLATPQFRANALRLGNVLGSPGSVLPLFEQQMREQRPLSITHPEAARWFFTPDETTNFIRSALAADVYSRVLIPPIGEPRRIADLARSLWLDAEIDFIGLRAGEKLTESFLAPGEEVERELPAGLKAVRTRGLTLEEADRHAAELRQALDAGDLPSVLRATQSLVPEYQPSSAVLEATAP